LWRISTPGAAIHFIIGATRLAVYLVAIVDLLGHKVPARRLSIKLSADFCVEALDEALARHGVGAPFDLTRHASR
jgi:hypothetical protein